MAFECACPTYSSYQFNYESKKITKKMYLFLLLPNTSRGVDKMSPKMEGEKKTFIL